MQPNGVLELESFCFPKNRNQKRKKGKSKENKLKSGAFTKQELMDTYLTASVNAVGQDKPAEYTLKSYLSKVNYRPNIARSKTPIQGDEANKGSRETVCLQVPAQSAEPAVFLFDIRNSSDSEKILKTINLLQKPKTFENDETTKTVLSQNSFSESHHSPFSISSTFHSQFLCNCNISKAALVNAFVPPEVDHTCGLLPENQKATFIPVAVFGSKKYKPVALKVKPVLAALPEKFRIIRNIVGDPLAEMPQLSSLPLRKER